MPIGDYCRRDPVTARPTLTLREAAELMKRANTGSLLIVEQDRLVGILTDRDVALGVLAGRLDPEHVEVKELMSRPVATLPERASVSRASRAMRRNALRRLPLLDEQGKLVGIVTSDDLLRLVTGELASLGRAVASQTPEQSSALVPGSA